MDQRTSFNDIPVEIMLDILARLSVKSIFVCRSLCKLLHSILVSSNFAKLHFSRASTSVLHVEPNSGDTVYTALHLLEFERDRQCRLCGNDNNSTKCASQKYKDHVNMKLSTRFMLPFLKSRTHRSISIVNSCNGLLLLHSSLSDLPVPTNLALKNDVIAIYNPVTGEYSIIPPPKFTIKRSIHVLGLGFCPQTDQYKVLIMVRKWITGNKRPTSSVYLIFTIGSGLWRSIENVPEECGRLLSGPPVFVNSGLHWFVGRFDIHESLTCFNLNDEKFHMIPLPPLPPPPSPRFVKKALVGLSKPNCGLPYCVCAIMHRFKRFIGVLRDDLILCDISPHHPLSYSLWVMRNDGIKEYWVQEQVLASFPSYSRPVLYLDIGDMSVYQLEPNALVFYDGNNARYFKICGSSSNITKVVLHVPSFLSLQEIVGDNAEVLRVTSRLPSCRGKGRKAKQLFLVEEDASALTHITF